ncbi:MAG: hypothetical protein PHQ73_12220 [Gallionella sp.]|nr:hypothetical protein [Gallionella sp.]
MAKYNKELMSDDIRALDERMLSWEQRAAQAQAKAAQAFGRLLNLARNQ